MERQALNLGSNGGRDQKFVLWLSAHSWTDGEGHKFRARRRLFYRRLLLPWPCKDRDLFYTSVTILHTSSAGLTSFCQHNNTRGGGSLVSRLLSAVCSLLSAVCCLLSAVCYSICCLLSLLSRLPSAVCRLSSLVSSLCRSCFVSLISLILFSEVGKTSGAIPCRYVRSERQTKSCARRLWQLTVGDIARMRLSLRSSPPHARVAGSSTRATLPRTEERGLR